MANEARQHQDFLTGLIEDNPLGSGATTLNSASLAAIAGGVPSTHHLAITLDPDGLDGAPEIVWITAHTASATSATIARGKEGTSARAHARDIPWVHSLTATDVIGQKGTGSPESVVTAPVGTLFLRTDGGTSTTLYVKETGSGNTGWVAK